MDTLSSSTKKGKTTSVPPFDPDAIFRDLDSWLPYHYDIYTLSDPRDDTIHYVGISSNIKARYKQHLKCKGYNPRKHTWIRELQTLNLQPTLTIIEEVQGLGTAKRREYYWIDFYGKQKCPLVNVQGHIRESVISDCEVQG